MLALTAFAIAKNYDQRFTTALPGYTQALQKHIEETSTAKKQLRDLSGSGEALAADKGPAAPQFGGRPTRSTRRDGKPLTLAGLRGKVVLIDFWTYSCINCLRTLPHLKAWDARYRKDGLVIVGVHTPEFAFEHVPSNVREAVQRSASSYPVALDGDYGTWNA